MTLTEFVTSIGDRWARGLDPTSTGEIYGFGLKLRVLPALGPLLVAQITVQHCPIPQPLPRVLVTIEEDGEEGPEIHPQKRQCLMKLASHQAFWWAVPRTQSNPETLTSILARECVFLRTPPDFPLFQFEELREFALEIREGCTPVYDLATSPLRRILNTGTTLVVPSEAKERSAHDPARGTARQPRSREVGTGR